MIPAPLFVGGLGQSTLIIGGLVFAVMFGGILLYLFKVVGGGNPWDAFVDATYEIVDSEDADAIAFLAYSDGPMIPKPAIYDRELLGGKGGYRTPDGERIYMDGQGNGKFSLEGVDVILAIDPTEHAAGADPLKAWIQHEKNTGRWIKVDRKGNLIEAGEALANVDADDDAVDTPEPAMDIPKGTPAADGGYPSEVHRTAHEDGMTLEDAKNTLEEANLLHKVVDIAPPREAVVDEETGEVRVEEADHVAVDISAAADMLPKKTNTTEWQVAEEKARQEGMDWEERRRDILIGIVVGAATAGVVSVVIALVLGFT